MAKVPFSDDIAHHVLENLKDPEFVQNLVDDLRTVFKVCSDTNLLINTQYLRRFSVTILIDPACPEITRMMILFSTPS